MSAPAKRQPTSVLGGYEPPASTRLGVYALDFRLSGSRLPRSTLVAYDRGGKILGRFGL